MLVGNKSTMDAVGKGTIKFKAHVDGKWLPCRMENVLHVPTARRNLFSVSSVLDKGMKFNSSKDSCEFRKNGVIKARGIRTNQLFKMLIRVKQPEKHAWERQICHRGSLYTCGMSVSVIKIRHMYGGFLKEFRLIFSMIINSVAHALRGSSIGTVFNNVNSVLNYLVRSYMLTFVVPWKKHQLVEQGTFSVLHVTTPDCAWSTS